MAHQPRLVQQLPCLQERRQRISGVKLAGCDRAAILLLRSVEGQARASSPAARLPEIGLDHPQVGQYGVGRSVGDPAPEVEHSNAVG